MLNVVRTLAQLAVNKILSVIIQSIIVLNIYQNFSSYIGVSYGSPGLRSSVGRLSAHCIKSGSCVSDLAGQSWYVKSACNKKSSLTVS